MQRHSGPLPTVKDFAGYEQACPGAARVILDMAVNQQKHLHWIEKSAVVLQCFGQVTAIAIISITLLAAYYFSDRHVWLAGLVLMGSVSGLVTILWPRRNNGESGGVASAEPEKKSNPAKRKTWK
jgi:uncharacterized membrane protein